MNNNRNKKGFTLAEVLITLTIIGVIAAILFPSILANYTERTLNAKRQALIARMSQAMGELSDQFKNYEDATCSDPNNPNTCEDNASALKFISQGLSSVYKISAICDADSLSSCDIPDSVVRMDGSTYSLKDAKTFHTFNPFMYIDLNTLRYDTKAAGFMTKNGESILLYFNPNCEGKVFSSENIHIEIKTCVNMVYDLNGGKKKPNRVGEDIGFMTVFYSNEPYVAAPRSYDINAVPDFSTTKNAEGTVELNETNLYTFDEAKAACSALGEDAILPSLEDGMALSVNFSLFRDRKDQLAPRDWFWTSTMATPTYSWVIRQCTGANDIPHQGSVLYVTTATKSDSHFTRCIYSN